MTVLRIVLLIGGTSTVLFAFAAPTPRLGAGQRQRSASGLALIGSSLRARAGLATDGVASLKWGRSLAVLPLALVHPAMPVLAILFLWVRPLLAQRRATAAEQEALWNAVPEVVDMLALTVRAGANLHHAIGEVGQMVPGVGGEAFALASARLQMGARMAAVLDEIASALGEPARSLVTTLQNCISGGTEIAPALERVASESRQQYRQHRLERARRIPVSLLFPLVTCTLPAFALLTVIPLVSSSLKQIGAG